MFVLPEAATIQEGGLPRPRGRRLSLYAQRKSLKKRAPVAWSSKTTTTLRASLAAESGRQSVHGLTAGARTSLSAPLWA